MAHTMSAAPRATSRRRGIWPLLAMSLVSPIAALAAAPVPPAPATAQATRIVAVVNGDVISNADVDNRARLFALSTGLPLTPDVLDRLRQQITRQLIDERLRMQEVLRRKIVIQDKMIAECDPRHRNAQWHAARRTATEARSGRRRASER